MNLCVSVNIVYTDTDERLPRCLWDVELSENGEPLSSARSDTLGEAFEQAYLIVAHDKGTPT